MRFMRLHKRALDVSSGYIFTMYDFHNCKKRYVKRTIIHFGGRNGILIQHSFGPKF